MSRIEQIREHVGTRDPLRGTARQVESNRMEMSAGTAALPLRLGWLARLEAWLVANHAAITTALILVVSLRVSLTVVGLMANAFIPENRIPLVVHPSQNPFIDMWARWDVIHYLQIAQQGYKPHTDNLAFFPLLPALMRITAVFMNGDLLSAGLLVTTLAFFAALFYLYKLVELEFDAEVAARTVLYLAIAPMAFFFLSVYTEPLFLLFSVASIYHARRNQWLFAVLWAALAVFTRPVGILLGVPLGYEALRLWWADKRNIWPALSLAVLPTALAGWMFYLYRLTGDMWAFVHAQAGNSWHRSSDAPWTTMLDAFRQLILTPPDTYNKAQYGVDLAATLILLGAAVMAFGYLPRIYSLYMGASVVFLLTSRSDIQVLFSMPRFAMVIFPLFMLLALAGKNPLFHRFITVAFPVVLGLYTALFIQWYWIA